MTKFDLIVAVLFLLSAGVGFLRGAIREVAALVALLAAAWLAIFGLPVLTPLMGHFIHTRWLAATAALVLVFAVTYIVLRLIGAVIAQNVQRTHVLGVLDRLAGLGIGVARGLVVLGGLYLMFNAATPEDLRPSWITGSATWPVARSMDRLAGLGIGVARGLVVLGGLYLMFNAATPEDLRPSWITGSATWPVARSMGRLITAVAPHGLDLAGRVKPAFDQAVRGGQRDRNAAGGYDARERGEIDDLVEKSR